MTIREAIAKAAAAFEAAGIENARWDALLLLEHVTGVPRMTLRLEGQRCLDAEKQTEFEALAQRRAAHEPLQYIIGTADFMGMCLSVRPGVLIPRADTEILAEEAVRRMPRPDAAVLDIGTGSGALAITLAKLCPQARVTAVDISDTALNIAEENAKRLGARVRFVRGDCFAPVAGERFDLIVSNPPYITGEEMAELMPEVRREPATALYGGEDGLTFYRRICREAGAHLSDGGVLIFEIGWQQKDAVEALLREQIGEPFALKDYGGNWRVVGARRRRSEAR